MLKRLLLELAEQKRPRRWLEQSRHGQRLAARFVAGRELEDALAAIERLAAAGMHATLDHLGENVRSKRAAAASAAAAEQSLEAIAKRRLPADISVKLTQFGLDLGEETAARNLRRAAERARALGSGVEVDMEGSAYTDATLRLIERLHAERLPVAAVLQAYLRRTPEDLERLVTLGLPVRLVKGAYREPDRLAHQSKRDVDASYLSLMRRLLGSGSYAAIATHDPKMIAAARARARELKLSAEEFEFQMLYGIRRDLQRELTAEGWRVRVYIPYGAEWYPYFMRRLAERPANAWFLLRQLTKS